MNRYKVTEVAEKGDEFCVSFETPDGFPYQGAMIRSEILPEIGSFFTANQFTTETVDMFLSNINRLAWKRV